MRCRTTVNRAIDLLRALRAEIRRHTFDTFVDQPPSVAQGGIEPLWLARAWLSQLAAIFHINATFFPQKCPIVETESTKPLNMNHFVMDLHEYRVGKRPAV